MYHYHFLYDLCYHGFSSLTINTTRLIFLVYRFVFDVFFCSQKLLGLSVTDGNRGLLRLMLEGAAVSVLLAPSLCASPLPGSVHRPVDSQITDTLGLPLVHAGHSLRFWNLSLHPSSFPPSFGGMVKIHAPFSGELSSVFLTEGH